MIELISLTKEVRKDLAAKINSLVVAEMMQKMAIEQGNSKSWKLWKQAEIDDTLYLLDKYDIVLPNAESFSLERARNAA